MIAFAHNIRSEDELDEAVLPPVAEEFDEDGNPIDDGDDEMEGMHEVGTDADPMDDGE